MKRFVVGVGVPGMFWADKGLQYTHRTFIKYCDGLGIHRELIASNTPQKNGPVKSAQVRTMKAGLTARLEVNTIFSDMHLDR